MLQVVLALVLVFAVIAIGFGVKGLIARRNEQLLGMELASSNNSPVVMYFTSPGCLPCKVEQEPELRRLEQQPNASFQLRTVDVSAEPEMARRFRVLSAPTTIVLDRDGRVAAVNVGTASAELLASQIEAALESVA